MFVEIIDKKENHDSGEMQIEGKTKKWSPD